MIIPRRSDRRPTNDGTKNDNDEAGDLWSVVVAQRNERTNERTKNERAADGRHERTREAGDVWNTRGSRSRFSRKKKKRSA
mmetsp:Transcript_17898/g.54747  ORF Transcript_17898/g.54747 Transcript_17898/m.54747 type:complete len:81 (-) Transcript_17898:150-392(-)